MKIIILEGIATSGKSSLAKELIRALPDLKAKVLTEDKTHEPILDQTTKTHASFFKKLIEDAVVEKQDLIVFERLYLSQAFRSKADLSMYSELEAMLVPYSPVTIFLKVDEDLIAERIKEAVKHRDPKWGEYVSKKGKNINEIADTYVQQQRHQLKLLEQSNIPYRVVNISKGNWQEIAQTILSDF